MNNTQIDRFPVSDLPGRYSLKSRTVVYDRLKALGIEPKKQGSKSYISGEHLHQLDQLHQHIQAGGGLSEFSDVHRTYGEHDEHDIIPAPHQDQDRALMLLSAISNLAPQKDQLSYLDRLLWCCQHQVLLSTSELAGLLGLNARTIQRHSQFQRCGFTFTKAGKTGNQSAWTVSKRVQ